MVPFKLNSLAKRLPNLRPGVLFGEIARESAKGKKDRLIAGYICPALTMFLGFYGERNLIFFWRIFILATVWYEWASTKFVFVL